MNHTSILLLVLLLSLFSCNRESTPTLEIREISEFNTNWKFIKGDIEGAWEMNADDSQWSTLDVPHDWSISEPYHPDNPGGFGTSYMIGGVGWYRKNFEVPLENDARRYEITFDGVYQNSTVWINGHELGTRPFGYITFSYDLTPYILAGETNVIAVKVDNSLQPNSRWYSGSGIYRNVWMTISDKTFLDPRGLFITTPAIQEANALVNIQSVIHNQYDRARHLNLISEVYSHTGKKVATINSMLNMEAGESKTIEQVASVDQPQLWSLENPNLYTLKQTLVENNAAVDDYLSTFGIRDFHFDPYEGFSLNGEQVKIKGVCMHHDLGALGAAINVRAMERQLEILKEMGTNAIRTSHNPPAPELLQLCDRMGFLVMNETFDEWKRTKTKYSYGIYWDEWHERDLRDHILRDRNHPSVIIWSIGNEILEQWHPEGTEMTVRLAEIVRELDPTRPITTGNNDPQPHNSLISSGKLDMIGFNYKHQDFEKFHETFPGQVFIGAETTSALATRGSYDMPSDSIRRWPIRWDLAFTQGNPDNTCSAYDNCSAPWGSTHAESWIPIKKHDYLSGMFVWTGFDYLGEPTPYQWPSKSSYFGIIDLAGFPKDVFYMYKSEWTHDTVLHVFPHWNWQPGQVIDIWAYYNHADEAELFLNGESKGILAKKEDDLHVAWRLNFEPGEVKVVTRRNGSTIREQIIHTASEPAQLRITADRNTIHSGGKDLSFVTIDILDAQGNIVPHASNKIHISVSGNGSLAGVDNGSPTSHHAFQGDSINAFHGKCLAIIKSGREKGDAEVTFSAEGLPAASISIKVN